MKRTFGNVYEGMPVLITGHTGFKGSWLSVWLRELGAQVVGLSLDPPTDPSNFVLSGLPDRMTDLRGDVRDLDTVRRAIREHRPRIVFHMAAQAIVLDSYEDPKDTFDVNVGGTVNLLEAVRESESVDAVVAVTSDKCYENQEIIWGYRESDPMGGHDPYSASKGMAELAVASYRRSFFVGARPGDRPISLASARAGNVIGGGDWAPYRLVPDCIRAFLDHGEMRLRNPAHRRPWQLVLEPLSGYLWLAAKLFRDEDDSLESAWNFGPLQFQAITTEDLVQRLIRLIGGGTYSAGVHQAEKETTLLRLDWTKAAHKLGWRPVYSVDDALATTVDWYQAYKRQLDEGGDVDMYGVCVDQIGRYTERARDLGLDWARPAVGP